MKVGMSIMRVAAVLVLSGLPTLGEAHNAVDDGGFVNEASAAEGQALIEASALEALAPGISSRGGLCVLIGGVDNVDLIKALVAEGSWTIHGLDSRHEVIEQMRGRLQDLGLYGRVTVEYWNAEELPYADNLVNVIITSDRKALPGREEIQRVLAPEGVAFAPEGERIVRFVKPRPEELGDWTHPWQDASGNPVSSDLVFEVPNTFQWVAGPLFPFSARKGSTHVILNSGGRTFYVTENVPMNRPLLQSEQPSTRKPPYLVARDSFNGTLLWSQPWDGPSGPGFSAPHEAIVVSSERVYVSRNPGHVAVLDANTGQTQAIWDTEGDVPRRLLLQDDVLVAQGREGLTAFDISDGTRLWLHQAEAPWSALVNEGRLFFLGSSREVSGEWKHDLYAVEMGGGEVLWQQPVESKYGHRNTAELRLMFAGAGVLVMIERTELRVMSAKDGAELWRHETEAQSRPIQGIDSRQAGHFLIDDAIWIRDRSQWAAHDPLTGEKLREVPGPGAGPNRACQMLTATRRFGVESRYSRLWSFTGEGGIAGEFMFARGGVYAWHNACEWNGLYSAKRMRLRGTGSAASRIYGHWTHR